MSILDHHALQIVLLVLAHKKGVVDFVALLRKSRVNLVVNSVRYHRPHLDGTMLLDGAFINELGQLGVRSDGLEELCVEGLVEVLHHL